MTCDVLAYPSMVLVFLCCLVFLLVHRSEKKWKELCAYVLPCVASAAVMFTYLLSYMTPQKMLEMAGEILGEGSHQTTVGEKLLGWGSSPGREMAMILLCALLVSLWGSEWFIEKVWKESSRRTAAASGHAVFVIVFLIRRSGSGCSVPF
ncbi:hypothetical protein [Gallintestinimicrobium sp.]|uniref:hypothetical protein n=1 Tax=Gallintestinimicrobium sp. TaxID=2981655 RepID=UPI003999B3B3